MYSFFFKRYTNVSKKNVSIAFHFCVLEYLTIFIEYTDILNKK